MRKQTRLLLPLAVIVAALIAGAGARLSQDARDRLMDGQSAFFDAVANLDADAVAGMFADDAVLHVAGMAPVEGREAILRFYGNLFQYLSTSTATPEFTEVSDSGEMAYSAGRTSNAFRGPQGSTEYSGKFLLVWKNVDGEWLVAAYSISSNQRETDR